MYNRLLHFIFLFISLQLITSIVSLFLLDFIYIHFFILFILYFFSKFFILISFPISSMLFINNIVLCINSLFFIYSSYNSIFIFLLKYLLHFLQTVILYIFFILL